MHDVRLRGNKDFEGGQKVLLFNSMMKLFSGKLKSHWYGPSVVKEVFPHGAVELIKEEGTPLKLNGHRVKHYEEGMLKEDKAGENVILGIVATT